jgi:glycosyltransferase involved in cell wall biosynthesis
MIKDLPKVSVAVVSYQQRELLQEALESILAQDYPNFEIVVADDGSTDGTHEMLREYETKYAGKFNLQLAKENKGITANSNAALFACSGKYIAWLGGDDIMLAGKLSKQVQILENNPDCALACHPLEVFDSKTNKTLYFRMKGPRFRGKIKNASREIIKTMNFIGGSSVMMRRDRTPKEGFTARLHHMSDWYFWVQTCISENGEEKTVYCQDEVLGRFRRHLGNVTNKSTPEHEMTLALVDHYYPQFWQETRYARAAMFGVRTLKSFALPMSWRARISLLNCATVYLFGIKSFFWFMRDCYYVLTSKDYRGSFKTFK